MTGAGASPQTSATLRPLFAACYENGQHTGSSVLLPGDTPPFLATTVSVVRFGGFSKYNSLSCGDSWPLIHSIKCVPVFNGASVRCVGAAFDTLFVCLCLLLACLLACLPAVECHAAACGAAGAGGRAGVRGRPLQRSERRQDCHGGSGSPRGGVRRALPDVPGARQGGGGHTGAVQPSRRPQRDGVARWVSVVARHQPHSVECHCAVRLCVCGFVQCPSPPRGRYAAAAAAAADTPTAPTTSPPCFCIP